MKISIILPVYNVEKYLANGLNSLLNQTYKDLEIICVNDGSTDSCQNILEEFAKKDSRIKVITQANAGTMIARKNGVMNATGEYITFLDPDDIFKEKSGIEDIVKAIDDTHADMILFGTTFDLEGYPKKEDIDFLNYHFNHCLKEIKELNSTKDILTECFVNKNIPYHQWGKAYKTALVQKALKDLPNIRCIFAEDQFTTLLIMNNIESMCTLNKKIYCYRIGVGISTQSTYTTERFNQCLQSFDLIEALDVYIDSQTKNKELLTNILKDIKNSSIKTLFLLVDRLEEGVETKEWLEPFLRKCPTDLLAKELRKKDYLSPEQAAEYESKIQTLLKKNYKHLKLLRICAILSSILLLTTIGLSIAIILN